MATTRTRLRDSRSWRFDLTLCVLGLALLGWCAPHAWASDWKVALSAQVRAHRNPVDHALTGVTWNRPARSANVD